MSNYTKATAILNRAAMQGIIKPLAYNVVMVQGNNNFKRGVITSFSGTDAEKLARSAASKLQWEEDDRCGGSSSNYFQVEAK